MAGFVKFCVILLLAIQQTIAQGGQPCYTASGAAGVCVSSCPIPYQLNINPFGFFGGAGQGCQSFFGFVNYCCSAAAFSSSTVPPAVAPTTAQTYQTGGTEASSPSTVFLLQPEPTVSTTSRSATIRTTTPVVLQNRLASAPTFDSPVVLPTPEQGCGVSDVEHNRVVGGVPAALNGWPWMALVGYKGTFGDIDFACGGSLITDRHVLTAAHCILPTLSLVRLGEHDTSNQTESAHVDVAVYKYISHPSYDTFDGHSDLAILYLTHTVEFTEQIKPICLPMAEPVRSTDFTGYNPFIAGWGRTKETGFESQVLQELQIPILVNEDCSQLYKKVRKLFSKKQFNDAVLCAGFLEGGKDSCQGDSGGPLMLPYLVNKKFHYFQIGIVSYGIGCARADLPGVYTRVVTFVDWIVEQTRTSTVSATIPFTPLTSSSLIFSTGTPPTGPPFTSTTFPTTSPTAPLTFNTPPITATVPVPIFTSTTFNTQASTSTGAGPTLSTNTIPISGLTSTPSTPLFPTVTFTNPPTGSTIPGAVLTSTLSPITPVTGISPLPTFPTFLTTINPPILTNDSCLTPNAQNGICIVYVNCDFILQLLIRNANLRDPTIESYVAQSLCGYSDVTPMVCCPTLRFAHQGTNTTSSYTTAPPVTTAPGSFFFASISGGSLTPGSGNVAPSSSTPKLPTNDADRCGMSNATHTRVVGGVDAQLNAWPWMAALGYRSSSFELNSGPRFLCGGTLITTAHVLTVAHCIQTGLYYVRLGEYDITSDQDGANPIDVYVQRWLVHERYDAKTIHNDIALVLLQKTVTITEAIRPICLPLDTKQRTKDITYYAPFIAGWGAVSFNGPSATKLQEAQVVVLPVDQCAFNYKLYFPGQIFDDTVLCAGFPQGGKDSCQGDSGGPLMLPELATNSQYYYYTLIGLVSYGYECARAGFPGVYVKVTAYLPWIESNINF
ncbi:uncharacterized protein LOC128716907 [Anopheles marshallii]|uniref:uncharacterized protein LOC128716907 n=1 Tax=Anopheles marshallii TaxID=1521116 RepID=UPI00237AF483|nr:uncharacterized protein LOC128716907 [Anopheles marshallii]